MPTAAPTASEAVGDVPAFGVTATLKRRGASTTVSGTRPALLHVGTPRYTR
jgi:hypothetical protein